MSTIYDKTDNYSLNLYGDNDPADLRDGYNGSMRIIDSTLETHLNRIEGVESRETHDEEVVKALLGDNTVDAATTAKNRWDTVDSKISSVMHDETIKGDGTSEAPLGIDDETMAKIVSLDNAVSSNVVLHGIDNTGAETVSDAINNLAETHKNLYFPAGIYLLDKTVTLTNVNMTCENNAIFRAVNAMDVMIDFKAPDIDYVTHYNLTGGTFDGAKKAETVLKFTSDNKTQISNLYITRATLCHLDLSQGHCTQVQNVFIDGQNGVDSTGIKTAFDDQFENIKIFRCKTGIQTRSYNCFTNVYIWSGMADFARKVRTIGFDITSDTSSIQISNLYLDCTQIGFNLKHKNDLVYGSGVFWFQDTQQVPDNIDTYVVFSPENDFKFDVRNLEMRQTRKTYFSNKVPESIFRMNTENQEKCEDFWHVSSSRNVENISLNFACTPSAEVKQNEAIPLFRVTGRTSDEFTVRSTTGEIIKLRCDIYNIHQTIMKISEGTLYIDTTTTMDDNLGMPYKTVWYVNKEGYDFKKRRFTLQFNANIETGVMSGYGRKNGLPGFSARPFSEIESNVTEITPRV